MMFDIYIAFEADNTVVVFVFWIDEGTVWESLVKACWFLLTVVKE
jgi:hypothetical protein